MSEFIFLWSPRNEEHIATHDVLPSEAEAVIANARPPFPEKIDDEKRLVWGQADDGRFLQVIFVLVMDDDIQRDEFEHLELHERLALQEGEQALRVIHARDLTKSERGQLRRRTRGRL